MKKLLVCSFLFLILAIYSLPPAIFANSSLDEINQKICDRFEEDLNKMAAIMEELRARKGITETRVAFGGVDTPIKAADYQITFAAEALAYQRAQKFSNKVNLRSSLETLRGKVLKAKVMVGGALK